MLNMASEMHEDQTRSIFTDIYAQIFGHMKWHKKEMQ